MIVTSYFMCPGNAKTIQFHTFWIRTSDMLRNEYGKSDNVGVPTQADWWIQVSDVSPYSSSFNVTMIL